MANIKDPSGSFYLDSSEFNVDYVKNKISLVGGTGGGGSSDITANGGTFNADAVLQGTDNLQITVPDAGESATVGVTPESVTISHNTNSDADGSIRVTAGGVELTAGESSIVFNGTGVNFGGSAITNVTSIGGSSGEIAFENDMDMNSHKITGLADPTGTTDAMTKNYADITYQPIANMSEYVRTDDLADIATAGIVKQATAVADSTGATDTALETKFNELLAALRTAGILALNA